MNNFMSNVSTYFFHLNFIEKRSTNLTFAVFKIVVINHIQCVCFANLILFVGAGFFFFFFLSGSSFAKSFRN